MKLQRYALYLGLTTLLFVLMLSGCSRYGRVVLEDDGGRVDVEIDKDPGVYDSGPDRGPARGPSRGHYESRLPDIPKGHMPPPGSCRIWYPGKPPGHQPPPGDCRELKRRLPPGAWLIGGDPQN